MVMTSPCPAGAPVLAIMSVRLENAPQSPDPISQHLASASVAPAQTGGISYLEELPSTLDTGEPCPDVHGYRTAKSEGGWL